ncbi:MAG: hypothetical protein A2Y48_01335 [Nitrospirae bacterium RIFCSPLOW2_12_42_9]|nr:MAG: hypothetical protein A2Y48_01335 [Nitrospirae bacterium RIFCSPLOW2_12_42_9]
MILSCFPELPFPTDVTSVSSDFKIGIQNYTWCHCNYTWCPYNYTRDVIMFGGGVACLYLLVKFRNEL